MRFLTGIILSVSIVGLLFAVYLRGRNDQEIRSLLPPEIGIERSPLLRHTESDWMRGCHLRVWDLRPETASRLRNDGQGWLESLNFDRHPSINTSRNYRADPWQEVTNGAVANPLGFLNLNCFEFDRHTLMPLFKDDTRSYFHRIGGESHVGFIFYPDSGRVLVLVSSS